MNQDEHQKILKISQIESHREHAEKLALSLSYDDVLLVPALSDINSRDDVDTKVRITPRLTLSIPIISSNMDTVTGVEMAVEIAKLGGLGILPRFDGVETQADKVAQVKKAGRVVGAAVGVKDGYVDRASALIKAGVDVLVLDVAHGHMTKSLEAVSMLKHAFNDVELICGNIATYEGARDLFNAGADCVKVGVGPGSICTTRIMSGSGVPQISAVLHAAKAAREAGKTIICDGGTKTPGDIAKGLAAGSSAVMIGSMLAGTDEAPGEVIEVQKKHTKEAYLLGLKLFEIEIREGKAQKFKRYNGSTSKAEKHSQVSKDSTDKSNSYVEYVEGVEAMVPYKGPVSSVVTRIMAGIRSGMSYTGSRTIEEFWENAEFVRITAQGVKESNAHDVHTL